MEGDRFWWRVGGLAMAIGLGYLVVRIVLPIWHPLIWAVLLGTLLVPLNERLAVRLGGRRTLACSLTTLATVLFFVLPLIGLFGAVAAQAAMLLERSESFVPRFTEYSGLDLEAIPWAARSLEWLSANTSVTLEQVQQWIVGGLRVILQKLVSSGGSVLLGALGTVVSFALMLFVLFFVLRDGREVARRLVAQLPIASTQRGRLWRHIVDVTRAVFIGVGLTAMAQGALVGIGFWIAGLPGALVFGVIAALFALIPMVGTAIVWAPGALFLAATGRHWMALFMVIWGVVVVGLADNILRPLLISGRADVPTLAVFIGVLGGLQAFGFVGLFLGPIVLGMLVALFRLRCEATEAGGPA
jgi:predicted PurR-regulated permease PerM